MLFLNLNSVYAVYVNSGVTTYSNTSGSTLRFDNNFNVDELSVDELSTNLTNITFVNSLIITNINETYSGKINLFGLSNVFVFYSNGSRYYATGNVQTSFQNNSYIALSNKPYIVNIESYNTTTYETAREYFFLNLTYDNYVYSAVSARLTYNGTNYTTIKSYVGSSVLFYAVIDVPLLSGSTNKSFYWNIGLTNASGTVYYDTDTNNQTLDVINLTACSSAPLNTAFINFTFVDETTGTPVNGSFVTGVFDYYLGSGTAYKELIFINLTANPSYGFCFTPANKVINLQYSVSYTATGYQTRVVNPIVTTYDNNTISKTLYLLGTSDGIYVTFQLVNLASQVLGDVSVSCDRLIGTELSNVAYGSTGDDGVVTLFLNPFFSHTCTFSKTNYQTYQTSFYPTQSSYTITLNSLNVTTTDDYTKGITYAITPTNSTLLNNTDYNFSFSLTTEIWEIDEFGFILTNSTDEIDSTSSYENGGILELTKNTGNNSQIIMNYYYRINDTYINGSKTWPVYTNANSEWSLLTFFTDFKRYMTSGMFGLDNFGLTIIVFLIILMSVGIMSYKFGLTSPAAISVLLFGIVFFLDISVGLIPNIGRVHFVTLFVGIITIGVVVREWTR